MRNELPNDGWWLPPVWIQMFDWEFVSLVTNVIVVQCYDWQTMRQVSIGGRTKGSFTSYAQCEECWCALGQSPSKGGTCIVQLRSPMSCRLNPIAQSALLHGWLFRVCKPCRYKELLLLGMMYSWNPHIPWHSWYEKIQQNGCLLQD
jgi:hypothetical protein